MTDGQITLTGIRAHANHGVLASERELGQTFSVDVSLDVDMDTVCDDLTHAVNYALVAQRVLDVLMGEPVNLIETLAGRIADAVLAISPRISSVQVTVHKPHAPVGVALDDVAVTCRKDAE
ncbi:dihydroneopterin aldolase [Cutibacterium sp. WCA-380-WT-3A]|uniref:7,8-dihydroneopterin aldolase n=1 Tax=Cutibacterium porci TaxID=2605781 RepID=A0A7K0J4U1_9ACTN|nr:dihydroneopterin aldolase [Cutibacterium porci]MSS44961.1 dihydroneopterin aldolase [Cutibacterium porci]